MRLFRREVAAALCAIGGRPQATRDLHHLAKRDVRRGDCELHLLRWRRSCRPAAYTRTAETRRAHRAARPAQCNPAAQPASRALLLPIATLKPAPEIIYLPSSSDFFCFTS